MTVKEIKGHSRGREGGREEGREREKRERERGNKRARRERGREGERERDSTREREGGKKRERGEGEWEREREGGREKENTKAHLISTHVIFLSESMHTHKAQGRKVRGEGGREVVADTRLIATTGGTIRQCSIDSSSWSSSISFNAWWAGKYCPN